MAHGEPDPSSWLGVVNGGPDCHGTHCLKNCLQNLGSRGHAEWDHVPIPGVWISVTRNRTDLQRRLWTRGPRPLPGFVSRTWKVVVEGRCVGRQAKLATVRRPRLAALPEGSMMRAASASLSDRPETLLGSSSIACCLSGEAPTREAALQPVGVLSRVFRLLSTVSLGCAEMCASSSSKASFVSGVSKCLAPSCSSSVGSGGPRVADRDHVHIDVSA